MTTGIATAYDPFNGRPIAMKQGSTLSYLHHDHLGSLVAATDPSGAEVGGASWARYSPFGQLRLSGGSLPSDRLFTGQTRDNVLGAGVAGNDAYYFFQARYYDATIGQFQSADTALPKLGTGPSDPRTLNRYAYARNNPLRLVDPTGHFSADQLKRWGYSQGQIDAWAKNDPQWGALVAAAQVGDVVTGLDPFTSGAPQAVAASFQVLPSNGRLNGTLWLVGPERSGNLSDFGQHVVQDRALWRPSYTSPGVAYNRVQTPETFIRSPGPGDWISPTAANPIAQVANAMHGTAKFIRNNITSNLDPLTPGPFTATSPYFEMGLAAGWESTVSRASPSLAGAGDTVVAAAEGASAIYDFLYHFVYGD